MLPMVYDAERRPREWSRRVAGLGGDRSRCVYVEPVDLPAKLAGRPLWEVSEYLGRIAARAGADLLIIDSIMPAVGLGEDRLKSDPQVPYLWVAALDALRIPSLSFGHPPKGQPEGEPFGSFAWAAAMRLTWLGTKAEGDGHRIRWRPRKRNERGHIPGVLLSVDYGDDGRPCGVTRADDEESTRDWLLAALIHGPRGVADMTEDVLAELEAAPAGEVDRVKERLSRALRRMLREGWVEKIGSRGRGVQWQSADPAMTCPVCQKGTRGSAVSGSLSGSAPLLSGSCTGLVRIYVRRHNRTHGGHVGSPCPAISGVRDRPGAGLRPVTTRINEGAGRNKSFRKASQSGGRNQSAGRAERLPGGRCHPGWSP